MAYHAFSIFFVTCLALLSMVYALPLNEEVLQKRGRQEIIGYRYVNPEVAQRYNEAGTLTLERANGLQTGEGAYISPGLNQWTPGPNQWKCVITADADKMHHIAKLWIPLHDSRNTPLFWPTNQSNLHTYIRKARLDPSNTFLFSIIDGSNPPLLQMLIPEGYLHRSGFWKSGSAIQGPDIQARCYPLNYPHLSTTQAAWGSWMIPGFGHI